jgi:hypothetical protein
MGEAGIRVAARTRLLAFVIALVLGPCWGTAEAATVTVGPNLTGPFEPVVFGSQRTLTNTTPSTSGNPIASPFNGFIRTWSVVGVSGGPVNLKIVRPVGAGLFITKGHLESGPITGTAVQTFDPTVNAHVEAGDLFGIDPVSTDGSGTIGIDFTDPQAGYSYWWPRLRRGEPARSPAEANVPGQVGVNVVIESSCLVPRLKGLRVKAARRALAVGNCGIGKARRPTKPRLRKKARFVIAQDAQPGMELPGQTRIGFTLGRKPRPKKTPSSR